MGTGTKSSAEPSAYEADNRSAPPRRPGRRIALAAGAAVGLALAAAGTFVPAGAIGRDAATDALVRVNRRTIHVSDLNEAIGSLSYTRSGEISAEDRREVLNRLIDEELLVQRGVEVGLVKSDRTVRKAIIRAVIDSIMAGAVGAEPEEGELRAFYESNLELFAKAARLHVREIFFSERDDPGRALSRAREAASAITNGAKFATVGDGDGEDVTVELPDAMLPPHVLSRHLGPTLTKAAMALRPGEISSPLESPTGYRLLQVVDSQEGQVQPYAALAEQVRAEYIRRGHDNTLRATLDQLWNEASISLMSAEATE